MDKLGLHFFVSGRVQGVGFRFFVEQCAMNLQIEGWVRNLKDGRVEGVAIGSPENLKKFRALLAEGPPISKVLGIEIREISAEESSAIETVKKNSFLIKKDGN